MSKEFVKLVRFYCQKINKVEWSGILFYEIKGSIRKPKSLKVYCKDIYLMDKGSSTYTSFNTDTSIAGYMVRNGLKKCKMGLIHSHNTMRVFFSGEDVDELYKTSPAHNFFLSLIVNNFGDACAKISFMAEHEQEIDVKYYAADENGDKYLVETIKQKVSKKRLYDYDCEVIQPVVPFAVEDKYAQRLQVIEERKEKEEKDKAAKIEADRKAQAAALSNKPYSGPYHGQQPPIYNLPQTESYKVSGWMTQKDAEAYNNFYQKQFDKQVEETLIEEAFCAYTLRLGHFIDGDDFQSAIEDIELCNMHPGNMSEAILRNFDNYYCTFFKKELADIDSAHYLSSLNYLLNMCETEKEETESKILFLEIFIPSLEQFIQLNQNGNTAETN